jgi:hypothetical protein
VDQNLKSKQIPTRASCSDRQVEQLDVDGVWDTREGVVST